MIGWEPENRKLAIQVTVPGITNTTNPRPNSGNHCVGGIKYVTRQPRYILSPDFPPSRTSHPLWGQGLSRKESSRLRPETRGTFLSHSTSLVLG